MTDDADRAVFDEGSGNVRFWVLIGDRILGASISKLALHHHYRPAAHGADPLETFEANRPDIEAAVRRRFAQGSLEPVMLREYDLRPPAAAAQLPS
jgi:hypothetical protein